MKVLMVSKALMVGAYHGKLRELARLGIDLTVIVPAQWAGHKAEVSEASDYRLEVLTCSLSGSHHFHFYRLGARSFSFDLIHIDEEPWSLVTYQFMRNSVKQGTPALFFTWQNIYKDYPQPFRYFQNYSFQHAVGAIAGNEEARAVLRSRNFEQPVKVIPQFGVDPQLFYKSDSSLLKAELGIIGKFAIGFAGRIIEAKGITDLLKALVLLPSECVLVILGRGPFEGRARKLAHVLGVEGRVYWIPHIPSLEMPRYMGVLDLLVLPSKTTRGWKEQFGRVIIEAMACETPVLGSTSGEIPAVIGDAGLIFAEGDVASLAKEVRKLYDDPKLRDQLGSSGRHRVLSLFTHERIAQKTKEFYLRILNRGKTGLEWPDVTYSTSGGEHAVLADAYTHDDH